MSMNRCQHCHHKISIIDSIMCKCKCGNVYCKLHRISHNCSFNYHEDYKLNNNFVKSEGKKLDKV